MRSEKHNQALQLLSRLKSALQDLIIFITQNENSIQEITGIPVSPNGFEGPPSIYTSSLSKALILQIYVDSLARNLGETMPDLLPS